MSFFLFLSFAFFLVTGFWLLVSLYFRLDSDILKIPQLQKPQEVQVQGFHVKGLPLAAGKLQVDFVLRDGFQALEFYRLDLVGLFLSEHGHGGDTKNA